jgi:predicted deacylase
VNRARIVYAGAYRVSVLRGTPAGLRAVSGKIVGAFAAEADPPGKIVLGLSLGKARDLGPSGVKPYYRGRSRFLVYYLGRGVSGGVTRSGAPSYSILYKLDFL